MFARASVLYNDGNDANNPVSSYAPSCLKKTSSRVYFAALSG